MRCTSLGWVLLAILAVPAQAGRPDPLAVRTERVLSRTLLGADLDGDGGRDRLVLVNAMTGQKKADRATDVLLGVYSDRDGEETLVWSRSLLGDGAGPCHGGEVTLIDLEGDGPPEVVLSWLVGAGETRRERRGEVMRWEGDGLRTVWSGVLELDTAEDPDTPAPERTRFERELDLPRTLASGGRTLFFTKRVQVAAGVRLEAERRVAESVPLPAFRRGGS